MRGRSVSRRGRTCSCCFRNSGRSRVIQGEADAALEPGDMYLVDFVRPSAFVYDGASAQLSLHLPRREMLHRFGTVCTGGVVSGATTRSSRRCGPCWSRWRTPDRRRGPARGAFLGLLGAYFHCVEAQVSLAGRTANAVLSRALEMIDRHARDPAFGPAALAERLNVSERTLQRHFQLLGETASRRILNARLEIAHARLLGARAAADLNIAAVAFGSGFNDVSYFYREFRRSTGLRRVPWHGRWRRVQAAWRLKSKIGRPGRSMVGRSASPNARRRRNGMTNFGLTIDGRPFEVGDSFAVLNPSTGAEAGRAPNAGAAELDAAVAAAKRAFAGWWRRTTPACARPARR